MWGDGLSYSCPYPLLTKNLFPIVLAASLWGHQWSAKWVEFRSDNTALVKVLRSSTSRNSNLMVLLHHLSLLAARHSFAFTARHVPGKSNAIADAISCFEFQQFRQLAPYASPTATSVPPWVLDQLPVVYTRSAHFISPAVWPLQPNGCIILHNVSSLISVR